MAKGSKVGQITNYSPENYFVKQQAFTYMIFIVPLFKGGSFTAKKSKLQKFQACITELRQCTTSNLKPFKLA